MNDTISSKQKDKTQKKYVSYREGAEMYSLGLNTFQKLAHEADACFKIGKRVIVNCELVEAYIKKCKY